MRMIRLPDAAPWAPLPIRLIVGYGFLAHGLAKLEKGPDRFVAIVDAIGAPLPHFTAWLTIWVEIIGGLCVIAGALVPLVAVPPRCSPSTSAMASPRSS